MMEIVWKQIPGYGKKYIISSNGEIIRRKQIVVDSRGRRLVLKERQCFPTIYNGYYTIGLSKNGIYKTFLLHRLIAITFIKNTNKINDCINHIDGNKLNNELSNLEWCTLAHNVRHAFSTGLMGPTTIAQISARSSSGKRRRKLNSKEAFEIFNSKLSNSMLGMKYSVSPTTVCLIKNKKIYKEFLC